MSSDYPRKEDFHPPRMKNGDADLCHRMIMHRPCIADCEICYGRAVHVYEHRVWKGNSPEKQRDFVNPYDLSVIPNNKTTVTLVDRHRPLFTKRVQAYNGGDDEENDVPM